MIAGTVYGTVLNDREERAALANAFTAAPYKAPPEAPVLYIKPRGCLVGDGANVILDADAPEVRVALTAGLLIGQPLRHAAPEVAMAAIAGIGLAIDISLPLADHYRPGVVQRCRDGFLPVGRILPFLPALLNVELTTRIDGEAVHRWGFDRLVRDVGALLSDISEFMTLAPGDMVLPGLAHDAPVARSGQRITAEGDALGALSIRLEGRKK